MPIIFAQLPPREPGTPGPSLHAANDLGIPGIYAEATGGGACREADVAACENGVLAVAALLGIVPSSMAPATRRPSRVLRQREPGKSCLNALTASPHDGIWISRVRLLRRVGVGDILGEVRDLDGECLDTLRAAVGGQIVLLRHSARVKKGEWLFCLA